MTGAAAAEQLSAKRTGVRHWMSGYAAMVRWEILGSRLFLPLLVIVQILSGAGFVVGFGLLIPDITEPMALYLSTGAVVISLILIGMLVTPQIVAQQKMEGSYDFVWSLPVPRSSAAMASMTLSAAVAIPGIIAALLVAIVRYDIGFDIQLSVIPAVVLTIACGSFLGALLAHGVENPQVTMMLTQLGIFFMIGFSPINFPIERLPGWLAAVHELLPFHHMALVVRSSMTEDLVEVTFRSWLVLTSWTAVAAAGTALLLTRRR